MLGLKARSLVRAVSWLTLRKGETVQKTWEYPVDKKKFQPCLMQLHSQFPFNEARGTIWQFSGTVCGILL